MADSNLNEPVIIQTTRLDTSVLPRNIFSQSYLLYVIAQGTDVGNVANKANEAGKGAYDAQVKNDEQDVTLADHESRIEAAEATLINHENRIAAAESTLADHESRIEAAEATLINHENRIAAAESTLADHETRITAAETELADHETRIAANESELANHDARITQNTTDIDALDTRLTAAEGSISTLQSTVGDHSTRISALEYATTRKKSEVVYSGVSVTIPTAPTNLVSLLKTLTPSSGTLAPFFDTVNNKMVVFNENKTLFFKLAIVGTWPSGTANRSMQLTFSGSVPDTLVSSRNSATTTDNILLATFFSVDKDGFLATNGSTLTIQSNGAAFTATTIKIIAEQ
ncbi:TPA: hypothetical protein OT820_001944 [Escherichia coli]|nr:hypothetical protein [Escherichia coli]